jgi:Ca2+-transporting ATPase
MANFFNQGINDVLDQLKTSDRAGLSSEEARRRLEEYGSNILEEKGSKSIVAMFFAQFRSFMIIILLVAAAISGVVGVMEGEGVLDTFVILGILIVNALIGAIQEKRAETSLEALKSMAAPASKVLRDGSIAELATRDIVPGDVVILETGSVIPADLRLTEAVNLKIQESSLTGESVPVDKQTEPISGEDVSLGDRTNMAYSSSMVTYGRGRGIVVNTGMKTEVGKIAHMLQHTEDMETPMSRRLNQLGRILGLVALGICGLIFLVGVLYGNSVLSMFMTAVTLAVAAIPEGLPAVSTIVLAIGVQRMVKRNAIIRNLPSVETLGSATVICSDKTGTLTQNKMTVVEAFVNHKHDQINRSAPGTRLNEEEERLLAISVLCADAYMKKNEDGKITFTGDPTETALLDFGLLYGVYKDELEKKYPRVAEIPFDSERKRMTTVNRMSEESTRVNVKGGLDEVLSACDRIIINGEIRPLRQADTDEIRNANEVMAGSALRVLAMAYKDLPEAPQRVTIGEMENGLIFIGLLGMIDPARPEVMEAVARCNTAGIRPVMITGDHKTTALAIAREIGIYKDGDIAVTGSELERMTDAELNETVTRFSVYARVAPEHKVRIVRAWQSNSEVVAMTGDGVNDAPALKQADIGAAMGIVGTDVAKGAADMILTDDNFATIVSAVEEGRRIYDNILKVIQYLLSTNVGEIFLILVTSIFNMGMPLLPIHILWINLVTDSLPALALSVDPPVKGIMNRKPRNPKGGFMTRGMTWRVMYQGVMIGCIPLVSYILGLHDGGEVLGRTMAFATLMFAQLVHVRNLHSNALSSFRTNPLNNKPLIGAIFASAVIGLAVLLVPPVRDAFSLAVMDREHWIIVIIMSLAPIVVVELFKLFRINGVKMDED